MRGRVVDDGGNPVAGFAIEATETAVLYLLWTFDELLPGKALPGAITGQAMRQGFDAQAGVPVFTPQSGAFVASVDAAGQGTFDRVMQAVERLEKHGVEFNALTCVNRHNGNHPLRVYRFLRDCGFEFLQFIPIVERLDHVKLPQPLLPRDHLQPTRRIDAELQPLVARAPYIQRRHPLDIRGQGNRHTFVVGLRGGGGRLRLHPRAGLRHEPDRRGSRLRRRARVARPVRFHVAQDVEWRAGPLLGRLRFPVVRRRGHRRRANRGIVGR